MTRATKSRKKKNSKAGSWGLRLLFWLVGFGVFLGLLGIAGVASLFYYYGQDADLPRMGSVRDYHPPMVTRIYDRHKILIAEISAERRSVVPYEKIPQLMVQAVLAAEDADFFHHQGLDYLGMFRAFVANLRAGRFVQGGSTITQQVVKTFFLSPERTIRRKMQEVILARRLESELSKEEILYLYLNQIYFGHGRYGVQEASRFFFGKDVHGLDIGEMALLGGLPQSPERLSPFKHPAEAKRRQTYVLNQMVRHQMIDATLARQLIDSPIKVIQNKRPYYNEAPEFTDLVRGELIQTFGERKLATMGLDVFTTLDVKLQMEAREAVQWGLSALDARNKYRTPVTHLKGKRLSRMLSSLKKKQSTLHQGKQYQAVVVTVNDGAQELEIDLGQSKGKVLLQDGGRYNPQKHTASKRFKPGDLIWVRYNGTDFHFDGGPQAALVAMEPQTGQVVAMIGGYDFLPGNFNRATRALRQPGSAFKPLVYATALDSQKFTAASIIEDAPVQFGSYEPQNYDGAYLGPVRLRQALAHSINTVATKLLYEVGVEPVRRLAADLGISSKLGNDLSLALGSSEVRPIELATAYSAIANGGMRVTPQTIARIGNQALERPEPEQVLRPEVAYIITSMMESVVTEGTGRRALRLRRHVAGKTGTTNDGRDAWFIGFTPQLVTVVWVGFDVPRSLGKGEAGSKSALPIWLRFMQKAMQGVTRQDFVMPLGVKKIRIDPTTGLLASEFAVDGMEELFIEGTEPVEFATPLDAIPLSPGIPIDPYAPIATDSGAPRSGDGILREHPAPVAPGPLNQPQPIKPVGAIPVAPDLP